MATLEELKRKFIQADRAGDTRSAQIFANEIRKLQSEPSAQPPEKAPIRNIMEDITSTLVSPAVGISRMFALRDKSPAEQARIRESERMMRGEMAEGLTLGGAGEIGAGIAGIGGALTGEGFMPAFQQSLAEREAKAKQFREQSPVASTIGQIAGALPVGVAAGTRLAATKLGQAIPKTAQAGLASLESGIYGLLGQQGDIEERAKAGAVGLGTGALLGTAAQTLPKVSESAQALIKRGIQPTVGQSFGRTIQSIEQSLESVPLVRDVIKGGQYQVMKQFDNEVIEEAMKPIGFKVPSGKSGVEVMEAAEDALNQAYNKAMRVSSLPDAKPLIDKMANIIKKNEDLVPERYDQLIKKLNKAVSPSFFDEGFRMSGTAVKKADSELGMEAARLAKGSPDEQQMSRAIYEFQKEFREELIRQNPDAKSLADARQAYKNLIPIRKASVASAKSVGDFTPAQLLTGLRQADPTSFKTRFGAGRMPQQQFAMQAEEALGRQIADSGSPVRLLTALQAANIGQIGATAIPAITALPFYQTAAGRQLARGILASPQKVAGLLSASPAVGGQVGIVATD